MALKDSKIAADQKQRTDFRIGELNPGLVGTDLLSKNESDKS
jgi:hypothetical protein